MAIVWIRQYYTLPIIFENFGMGDEQSHRRQPQLTDDTEDQRRAPNPNWTLNPAMEYGHYSAQPMSQAQYSNMTSFNMGGVASALPDYQYRNYGPQSIQHQLSSSPHNNLQYQVQQASHLSGQAAPMFNPTMQQQYAIQSPPQQQHHVRPTDMQYPQYVGPTQAGLQNLHPQYQPQTQQYYQQQAVTSYGQSYALRGGAGFPMAQMQVDNSLTTGLALPVQQGVTKNLSRHSSDSSLRASVPRGPPRKPKQSGHALWVGNLPPGTHVIDLKDHFSRDATEEIESVFLISKSNCAFVNYKTETSCAAAMTRFHDSRFQGVRLVCRLRRGSAPSSATPASGSQGQDGKQAAGEVVDSGAASAKGDAAVGPEQSEDKVKEKFFIVKSLTVEDLELSARNGTWATQAHNEVALNKAYQTAENVYLIFSANKSGEYFGYARMASNIDEEGVPEAEQVRRPEIHQSTPAELPVTIPTPATATAPKGHIIDDSARGTIFWEAEVEEGERADDSGNISGEGEEASPSASQVFGKPFKIEWLSTDHLPFYRTRGLRNPWNSNREVKIARDGTELEPSIGRRLISMFHRPSMPSLSPNSARLPQQLQPGYLRPS